MLKTIIFYQSFWDCWECFKTDPIITGWFLPPPPPDCLETSCSSCYPVSFMAKVVPATVRLIKCLELQPYASIINKIIFLKTSGTIKENSDNWFYINRSVFYSSFWSILIGAFITHKLYMVLWISPLCCREKRFLKYGSPTRQRLVQWDGDQTASVGVLLWDRIIQFLSGGCTLLTFTSRDFVKSLRV